jgi:hypothetical protein
MPCATWCDVPADASALHGVTAEALAEWHVRSAFLPLWVQTACDKARDVETLRVVLDYDPDAGLLSFDTFNGDRRVYGADDWIG